MGLLALSNQSMFTTKTVKKLFFGKNDGELRERLKKMYFPEIMLTTGITKTVKLPKRCTFHF